MDGHLQIVRMSLIAKLQTQFCADPEQISNFTLNAFSYNLEETPAQYKHMMIPAYYEQARHLISPHSLNRLSIVDLELRFSDTG